MYMTNLLGSSHVTLLEVRREGFDASVEVENGSLVVGKNDSKTFIDVSQK